MMIDTGPKFYSVIPLAHGLKVKVKLRNFILKCFKSSYFPNYMIDLVYIWNNRYRSKVLFVISPTHSYDLKVKVTDLEILYLIPDNVKFMTTSRPQGSVGCASDWRPGGRGFDPRRGRQHSFVEIDHEIFSTVILSLPLIQEGQLSVSGERMCTILVDRLED